MKEISVGTGPYRLAEHELGKRFRLVRNPDYFKGGPKSQPSIEQIEVRSVPDGQTRVAEVVAGGVDLIADVPRDQAEQLRDTSGVQIISGSTMRYTFLQLNTLGVTPAPPLHDLRVRKAIMHAIDREGIAKFLVGENSRVLHVECHPSDFGCADSDAPRYDYDPAKARQLLAEAGYPGGFGLDIYTWWDRNQAEAIINNLRAVGIAARLHVVQAATMVATRRSGRAAAVFTISTPGIADVSNSASRYSGGGADDLNRDLEIGMLLGHGDSAMDPEERKAAYAKALQLIAERAYVLPLYSIEPYYVAAKNLAFKPHPDELPRFYEMSWK
jgi:peptide/nickel transport system substrate-binding protein